MSTFTMKDAVPVTPLEFEEFDGRLELVCRTCRSHGKYSVGRIFINPSTVRRAQADEISFHEAVFFSGYFRCKNCGLGGPWDIPQATQTRLELLLLMAGGKETTLPIHIGELRLFDGSRCHSGGEGEIYLQRLIAADATNYFLWSRLGNLYSVAGEPDRALPAFQKAVELNPYDVESHHSVAEIYRARGQFDEAAEHYHQVLLHARHAPPRTQERGSLLKNVVRHTLECLADLHERSGKRIEFLPPRTPVNSADADPNGTILVLKKFDLSKEDGWEELTNTFMGEATADHAAASPLLRELAVSTSRIPAPNEKGRVGRNDPCPCGSGKKFKKCCMR